MRPLQVVRLIGGFFIGLGLIVGIREANIIAGITPFGQHLSSGLGYGAWSTRAESGNHLLLYERGLGSNRKSRSKVAHNEKILIR